MTNAPSTPAVLCFGEILWDCLDAGLFPGGAPFNVAYHLHQLGTRARIVSATGADFLGRELRRRLRVWQISDESIFEHADAPTGTVIAQVGPSGDAHYEITEHVAWDRVELSDTLLAETQSARALIFGSLAQRSPHNQRTLARLLDALPSTSERIFDVNLRAPFDDLRRVESLARLATTLKLNAEESARLNGQDAAASDPRVLEAQARALQQRTGASRVIITAGAQGAGYLDKTAWYYEPARPVSVVDTIGAGDAFLAHFTHDLLTKPKASAAEVLARACRHGEWVATQRGATPKYPH